MQLSLKGPEDIVKIEKVAVIGAGVMGSGIAAHVANAGLPVTLLDIVPKGAENRNVITESFYCERNIFLAHNIFCS